ncbi:hypothetical protein KFK09_028464 [Dendrobium nobile]|uniref:Pentatricopeptide repeat-containing protein n=1 Tax=Dendrobium nobile TaxID=94219 RepID=A0A8T3A1M3_DENNO|nr:hypothetical protein KFK09_028464 [Dendrobium nobile]
MVGSLFRPIHFLFNISPLIHFSLSSSLIPLHALTPRCLLRHLGFACHFLLDSDSLNSDELEMEHDFSRPVSENHFIPIINRTIYPARKINTGNSFHRKYSFDRKWRHKGNLIKRITLALSKQGWDLNFQAFFSIDQDSWYFTRMLNDLFDESLDGALVYYLFRMLHRYDDKSENKLNIYCTMVHIAILGNMNHVAMDLLCRIVRSNDPFEDGLNMIFHALWQTRRNAGELETAYSMLVICFAEQGMLDMSVKLMTRMEKFCFYPSNGVYIAVGFLLKSRFTNKFESDRHLFVEMENLGARLIGLTVSLFIREFVAFGCLESACKLLYDTPTFGGKADNVAYTIVIDAFCKRGFLKEATSLLFKMVQMGLSLDSTLIASLVHGYCKIGKMEAALILLNISACVPDSYVYNSFIFTWCQNGDVESAHALLNMMFELDVTPDCVNYTTLIKGYCKLYRINHAMKTFAQMTKRGVEPTIVTYTVLVDGHCKIDDIQGAEFVFNALERDGLQADVATYNTLINGYSKKGHMHKAYELVDLMKKAGVSPDSVTYNMIMHGLIKRGFSIRTIFNELVRRGYSPDEVYSSDKFTCTNIVHGYSKEGRLEEAYLIWCSMSKRGMTPDVVTCSALLNGFCKMRRMQDADVLFHKLLDAGLKPDLILYNTLIRGFCNVGDICKACQFLVMMKASGIFPNDITKYALIIGLEKKGVETPQESAAMLIRQLFLME